MSTKLAECVIPHQHSDERHREVCVPRAALQRIAEMPCRPLYGRDGSKLDDVHELECHACIARAALAKAVRQ